MSFREFAEESKELIFEALKSLNYPIPDSLVWNEPPDENYGDLSFRLAFDLARNLQKEPAEIASVIARRAAELNKGKQIGSVEGHPSGHINFRINLAPFAAAVLSHSKSEKFGKIDLGRGKSVLIEHTAVNPNKAVHIGHLRNIAIGDCMARIFEFTNHKVSVLNYIDDSGLQVADILVGMLHLGMPKDGPSGMKYDHYAGDDVYVEVNRRYEMEPGLKEIQRSVLKAIEERDPIIFDFAVEVTDRILKEQLKTSWRFNAHYDLLVYESDIIASHLWEMTFEMLKKKGIAKYESEGKFERCWIVTVKGEAEGEDKILVRSDGTATYIAKDTPFAALKVGLIPDVFSYGKFLVQPDGKDLWRTRVDGGEAKTSPVPWGSSKSITVIDSRQARLQRIVKHILEQLANENLEEKYLHLGYSIISLSPRTAAKLSERSSDSTPEENVSRSERVVTMSGRKGTYVNADDVIDQVKSKALEETRKRNPDISDPDWLDNVSEQLAVSAIRFALLKQDLDKMIIFDLEESIQLIGKTGPYMLYTFARASSIITKLNTILSEEKSDTSLLNDETEIELIKLISKFDIAVEKSVNTLAPKWIAHYSFDLCEAFNRFYEKNRVLQEKDEALRAARIQLVEAFRAVLKQSLSTLGIQVLNKI